MSKHIKGPLKVLHGVDNRRDKHWLMIAPTNGDPPVAAVRLTSQGGNTKEELAAINAAEEATAERIVACYNACEGIDDLSVIEKFKQQLADDSGDPCFAPHWPAALKMSQFYRLPCDDKGHSGGTWLQVMVAEDGDVHVSMQDWEDRPNGSPSPNPSLRVRTRRGGGRNPRVRQALLELAEAIHLDNLDNGRKSE